MGQELESLFEDCTTYTKDISNAQEHVAHDDAGVTQRRVIALTKLLSALESRVRAARTKIQNLNSSTAYTRSIDKVDEVTLRNIFAYAVADETAEGEVWPDENLPAWQHVPEILADVNRHWRKTAMNDPFLWTLIRADSCHSANRTERWLVRSCGLPIRVIWRTPEVADDPLGNTAVPLVPYLSRVTRLDIQADQEDISTSSDLFFQHILGPLSHLGALQTLTFNGSSYYAEGADLLSSFRSVRHFELHDYGLTWSWPLERLVVLKLTMRLGQHMLTSQLRDTLTASPELEELELCVSSGWNDRGAIRTWDRHCLPVYMKLRRFHLHPGESFHQTGGKVAMQWLLEAVRAPSLSFFAVKASALPPVDATIIRTLGFSTAISHLQLFLRWYSIERLKPLLNLASIALENLSLSGHDIEKVKIADNIFKQLDRFKQLRTLRLEKLEFSKEALVAMVTRRLGLPGWAPLEKFTGTSHSLSSKTRTVLKDAGVKWSSW